MPDSCEGCSRLSDSKDDFPLLSQRKMAGTKASHFELN